MADEMKQVNVSDEEIDAVLDEISKSLGEEMTPEERAEAKEIILNEYLKGEKEPIEVDYKDVDELPNDVIEVPVSENVIEDVYSSDVQSGDVVTLDPDIADIIDDYDPSDVYRIESINEGFAKLSRNGQNVPELSYIPLSKLSKSEFVSTDASDINYDADEKAEETESAVLEEQEDIVAVEKGSKPIRWAKHFIDKVRQNVSVDEISKKLEASIEKDKEKSEEVEDLNLNGQMSSFKTSLLSTELKIAKKASNRWNKITGWFKKDKIENSEELDEEIQIEEQTSELNESTENIISSAKPYDIFKELPEDRKAAVLEDLIKGLSFQGKELSETKELNTQQAEKLSEAEVSLENAKDAVNQSATVIASLEAKVAELNAKIEELTKGNVESKEDSENKEQGIVSENDEQIGAEKLSETEVSLEKATNNINQSLTALQDTINRANASYEEREAKFAELNAINEELTKYTEELIKGNAESKEDSENKEQGIVSENDEQIGNDPISATPVVDPIVESAPEVQPVAEDNQELANDDRFSISEQFQKRLSEEQRYAKFWEEAAPVIENEEYIQAIQDKSAAEIKDYEENVKNPEAAKREELIQQNRLNALKNKITANAILGNVTPEMIEQMNSVIDDGLSNEDENSQGFHR